MRRLCCNFTLRIFLSVANVSKIRKQNVILFVLSVIAHMFTMTLIALITYADEISYRWLEMYGGVLSYRGYTKPVQCQSSPVHISPHPILCLFLRYKKV